MNTPTHPPQQASAPLIPTGEAQVGVVSKAQPAATAPEQTLQPEPVLEHRIEVPPAPTPASAAASAPAAATDAAPAGTVQARVQELASAAPLQDSPPVPIPERMNQLSAENKRLRDDMQSLEKALKKTLN